jgi:hypothetical protein
MSTTYLAPSPGGPYIDDPDDPDDLDHPHLHIPAGPHEFAGPF